MLLNKFGTRGREMKKTAENAGGVSVPYIP